MIRGKLLVPLNCTKKEVGILNVVRGTESNQIPADQNEFKR